MQESRSFVQVDPRRRSDKAGDTALRCSVELDRRWRQAGRSSGSSIFERVHDGSVGSRGARISTPRSPRPWTTYRPGVTVDSTPNHRSGRARRFLRGVLATRPQLLLDNGGDLYRPLPPGAYDGLLGGTEETTSGRARSCDARLLDRPSWSSTTAHQAVRREPARGRPKCRRVLPAHHEPIDQRAAGDRFGYGMRAGWSRSTFRNAHARVAVVEIDPVLRLEALLTVSRTGPGTMPCRSRCHRHRHRRGARDRQPRLARFARRRDPFSTPGICRIEESTRPGSPPTRGSGPGKRGRTVSRRFGCGRSRRGTCSRRAHGEPAGPRPMANSIESMDLGFTLQARCLSSRCGHGRCPGLRRAGTARHDAAVAEARPRWPTSDDARADKLPKAHLHVHSEGAMRPSTLADLAGENGAPVRTCTATVTSSLRQRFDDAQDQSGRGANWPCGP